MRKTILLCVLISLVSCSKESRNVSYLEFKKSVSEEYAQNEHWTKETIDEDKIKLLKMYNSIIFYSLEDSLPFEVFKEKFQKSLSDTSFFSSIGLKPSIGLSLYSEKYDIFCGGIPFDPRSTIFIDFNTLPAKSKKIVEEMLKRKNFPERDSLLVQ